MSIAAGGDIGTPVATSASAPPIGTVPAVPAVRVLSLYPDLMDVYADRGNLLALRARARTVGVALQERTVTLGEALPPADLVLIGGGQDREQRLVAPDLARHAETLRRWAADGVAMLAICGGFQLFGRWYRTRAGEELPGVGIFDVTTVSPDAGAPRCIGDLLIRREGAPGSGPLPGAEIVGFENHAGRTFLGPGAEPLGRVLHGFGNNGEDETEGALQGRAIGTYLHGPLLPKHPALSDQLLTWALEHRGVSPPPTLAAPPAQRPVDRFAEAAYRAAVRVARKRAPAR